MSMPTIFKSEVLDILLAVHGAAVVASEGRRPEYVKGHAAAIQATALSLGYMITLSGNDAHISKAPEGKRRLIT